MATSNTGTSASLESLPAVAAKKMTPAEAAEFLAGWYRLLFEPGQVIELRALDVRHGSGRPHVESGFFDFDHLTEMAKAALAITGKAKGVYATLNPLNPDLLARRCYRVDWANEGELAADTHVLRRHWLLLDADPVRDRFISATDSEKAAAKDTILAVREHLSGRQWPEPFLSDSGNGFHLLYPIDLPANDGGEVARILQALAKRFDSDQVKIDQSVHNPSRIFKLPGTLARKGDNTPLRPHRRAKLLEGPGL